MWLAAGEGKPAETEVIKSGRAHLVEPSGRYTASTSEYENMALFHPRKDVQSAGFYTASVPMTILLFPCEKTFVAEAAAARRLADSRRASARDVEERASGCASTPVRRAASSRAAAEAVVRLRGFSFTARAFSPLLDAAQQQKGDHDEQDEAESPARVVAPAAAVGPGGRGPDEQKYQDDNQDQRHNVYSSSSRQAGVCGGLRDFEAGLPRVSTVIFERKRSDLLALPDAR